MTTLLDSLRGTLVGVLGAAEHLAWYLEWQAGGRRCARDLDGTEAVLRQSGLETQAA